jgi:hypothetical protein
VATRPPRVSIQKRCLPPTRGLLADTQQQREPDQEAKTQGNRAKSKLNSTAVIEPVGCKPTAGMPAVITAIARDGAGDGQRNGDSRPYQATEHHVAVEVIANQSPRQTAALSIL